VFGNMLPQMREPGFKKTENNTRSFFPTENLCVCVFFKNQTDTLGWKWTSRLLLDISFACLGPHEKPHPKMFVAPLLCKERRKVASFMVRTKYFLLVLNYTYFIPHSLSSSSTSSCDQQCKLVWHPLNRPIGNNNVNTKSPGGGILVFKGGNPSVYVCVFVTLRA
jgi:hypothetical protein